MSNNIDPTSRTGFFSRLLRTDEAEEKEAPPQSLLKAKAAGDSFESGPIVKLASDDNENPENSERPLTTLVNGEGFREKLHQASQNQNLEEGQFDMAALEQLAQGTGVFSDATPEQMQAAQYYLDHSGELESLDAADQNSDDIYSFDVLTLLDGTVDNLIDFLGDPESK
jgi:hypothetical protein